VGVFLGLKPKGAKIRREWPQKGTKGAKKLVGRKSRRAHDCRHAKPLIGAGFELFCAVAGMGQYLSRTCDVPFQKNHGKDTSTPRLKSGAI
jgi:hypothetical protein